MRFKKYHAIADRMGLVLLACLRGARREGGSSATRPSREPPAPSHPPKGPWRPLLVSPQYPRSIQCPASSHRMVRCIGVALVGLAGGLLTLLRTHYGCAAACTLHTPSGFCFIHYFVGRGGVCTVVILLHKF